MDSSLGSTCFSNDILSRERQENVTNFTFQLDKKVKPNIFSSVLKIWFICEHLKSKSV